MERPARCCRICIIWMSVHPKRERYSGGTLRIGAFGATRALKNLMTAAGAALEIANCETCRS